MNQQDIEVCKTLGRINRFSFTHGGALPAGSIAGTQFARCVTLVVEIGPDDTASGTPASPATAAMDHLFDKVWEDLKAVSGTARTINTTEPGFSTRFRLGDDTHEAILATAADFLEDLADAATVAKFIAYLLPADFVTTLQADLAKISGKGGEQTDDQLADVGDTAQTRALIKEGRALIKSLNTSVRNFFRTHPAILAEWRTASRIRQTGGSGEPEETTPATPAPATP
jgi:hypothetical protein